MITSPDRGALAIMRMGQGYSVVRLPGGIPPAAGNTAGRMHNNLQELQQYLRSLNVPERAIPKADFLAPMTIEL